MISVHTRSRHFLRKMQHDAEGLENPCVLISGEYPMLKRKNIHAKFSGKTMSRVQDKGVVYLTTHRIIFVPSRNHANKRFWEDNNGSISIYFQSEELFFLIIVSNDLFLSHGVEDVLLLVVLPRRFPRTIQPAVIQRKQHCGKSSY